MHATYDACAGQAYKDASEDVEMDEEHLPVVHHNTYDERKRKISSGSVNKDNNLMMMIQEQWNSIDVVFSQQP